MSFSRRGLGSSPLRPGVKLGRQAAGVRKILIEHASLELRAAIEEKRLMLEKDRHPR